MHSSSRRWKWPLRVLLLSALYGCIYHWEIAMNLDDFESIWIVGTGKESRLFERWWERYLYRYIEIVYLS
jgi:hypothetical protein